MAASGPQLEKRKKLRTRYEMGVPAPIAAEQVGLLRVTVYRWYKQWAWEDGEKAARCACGRPLVHSGRCAYRPARRGDGPPVYDGPDFIGKAMTADEAAAFRALQK